MPTSTRSIVREPALLLMPEAEFEPARALETLDRHGVEYVLVGGLGARAHGATRPTSDIDLVPDGEGENLERLAAAFREMNARLRIGGMTDDEARQLPAHLTETLRSFGSSTWMTDAGPIDVLRDFATGKDVMLLSMG